MKDTPDLLRVLSERQAQARATPSPYLRVIPGHNSMAYWLAKACTEARATAGRLQVHVAASASVSQSSIDRFENGDVWPRNPDRFVAAYADDLDITELELWETAIQMWKRDRATQPSPQAEAVAAVRKRAESPAAKPPAGPSKRSGPRRSKRAA